MLMSFSKNEFPFFFADDFIADYSCGTVFLGHLLLYHTLYRLPNEQ